MKHHISLLYSKKNLGDVSHANALVAKFGDNVIIDQHLEPNEPIKGYGHTNLVAVGEVALKSLINLKTQYPDLKVAVSIHQYFDDIRTLTGHINFISIPKSVIDSYAKKLAIESIAHHHFTLGVPTKNPTPEELKAHYDGWEHKDKTPTDQSYIIVTLPGDAPDNQGQIKRFDANSADQLIKDVQQLWENNGRRHHIIIQNSPRTGKFGSENDKDIICSHGYKPNEQPSVAVDKISQYFTAKLTDLKIPHSFYNFAFKLNAEGKIESNSSVYNQLLYLSQTNPNNYFIVPCESMSMLSQIPLYLNPDQVIAFHPSSENAQHTGIFNEAFKRGHLCQFDEKHEVSRPENLVKLLSDDAQDVASSLLKFLGAEKSLCLER